LSTPERAASRGRRSADGLLALICTAQFVLALDFSIVNVALPTIQRELHFSEANLQWTITGYALTFGSLLLLGGRAGDLLGRRRLLVIGLIVFAVSSLTCGLAQTSLMLVLSRVVQGVGGAMISPAALSLLTSSNPEGPARVRALGIWQAAAAGGASSGVVLGGLLTQYVGWRAIFLINLPIVAIMLLLIPRMLKSDRPTGSARLDFEGATIITVAIGALIFGLSNGEQRGFTSIGTAIALGLLILLSASFPFVERRSSSPMLPPSLLQSATRRTGYATMLMMGAIVVAYVYFASLYLQKVLHFAPVITGVCFLPATLTVMLTATLVTRRVLNRFGVKATLIGGLASVALGQLWLAHVAVGGTYWETVLPGQLLSAFGMGLVFPTASVGGTAGVPMGDQGLAAGLLNTSQQVGSAVGLALLATIASVVTKSSHHSLAAGFRISYYVATGLMVVSMVLVATMLSGPQCQQEAARRKLLTSSS